MRILLLVFIVFNFVYFSAQTSETNLFQDWVFTKVEMKDGNKPFYKEKSFLLNHGIRIEKDWYLIEEINSLNSFKTSRLPYFWIKNELKTSPEASLIIEKLTPDSLIISENIQNMEESKLYRYFAVPLDKARIERRALFKGKDTLISNAVLNPYLKLNPTKTNLRSMTLNDRSGKNETKNFQFKGFLLLDLKEKKAQTFVENNESVYAKETELISKNLAESFNHWNIAPFTEFKFIKIPFTFVRFNRQKDSVLFYGDIYTFHSDAYEDISFSAATSLDFESGESDRFFALGVAEFQKKNYEESAVFFEKAFIVNHRNLDAYYNFAAVSYSIGNTVRACQIYQFLVDQGQKSAEKIYLGKCEK